MAPQSGSKDQASILHPGRGLARFFHVYFIAHTAVPLTALWILRSIFLSRGGDFSHAWRVTDLASYHQWVCLGVCLGTCCCTVSGTTIVGVTTGAQHRQSGGNHSIDDGTWHPQTTNNTYAYKTHNNQPVLLNTQLLKARTVDDGVDTLLLIIKLAAIALTVSMDWRLTIAYIIMLLCTLVYLLVYSYCHWCTSSCTYQSPCGKSACLAIKHVHLYMPTNSYTFTHSHHPHHQWCCFCFPILAIKDLTMYWNSHPNSCSSLYSHHHRVQHHSCHPDQVPHKTFGWYVCWHMGEHGHHMVCVRILMYILYIHLYAHINHCLSNSTTPPSHVPPRITPHTPTPLHPPPPPPNPRYTCTNVVQRSPTTNSPSLQSSPCNTATTHTYNSAESTYSNGPLCRPHWGCQWTSSL